MDCLDMAENNNLTSISLPAIGTGELCFPTAVVASLMLDTILEFSKKRKPKHLKMVVIVLYPSDRQCIQVRKACTLIYHIQIHSKSSSYLNIGCFSLDFHSSSCIWQFSAGYFFNLLCFFWRFTLIYESSKHNKGN